MREAFDTYNATHFGGALPPIALQLSRSLRDYGSCSQPCRTWPWGRIRISSLLDMPHVGWRGVLLHEMVHASIWQREGDFGEEPDGGHGADFERECARIGRAIGLPDAGEDEACYWPWIVF